MIKRIGFIGAFFVCLFVVNDVLAQHQFSLYGSVTDSLGNPLQSVNVRLFTENDTIVKSTDFFGRYKFESFSGSTVVLVYSILGFSEEHRTIFTNADNSKIFLPAVKLKQKPLEIKSVNINKMIPVVFSGDTIQFNMNAFQFRKNSLLEEALKNLPGFQVSRDGKVYYNGQAIHRGQVDGKDFFGGDLQVATTYLPVDFIKSIQVIDYYGNKEQQTGIKSGDSEKIINIVLKEDRKQIYFGQITLGGGTNDRYIGSLGINKFDDGNEFSILGSFNNTNTNLFSFGNPTGGNRNRSSLDIGDYADPIDGLNTISSVGFNLRNQVNKNTSFTVSYNYIRQNSVVDGFSQLTSTYVNNIIQRKENTIKDNLDQNHKLKYGFDTKFRNNDLLKIEGNLSLHQLSGKNVKHTELKNYDMVNLGVYNDSISHFSPNGDIDVMYAKYFEKKGRKLVGNLYLNSNNLRKRENVDERFNRYDVLGNVDPDYKFVQNQYINQQNVSNSAKGTISFVEPFLSYSLFEFSYDYEITHIDANRYVESRLNPDEPFIIDSLAVDYNYLFRNNKTSITYQYEPSKRFKLNVGFGVQPLTLVGNLRREQVEYRYENVNLLPSANVLYRLSSDMDVQFDYKGKNNQPHFSQISPVVDNTNSRYIIRGNPELKAESAHRVSSRMRKTIASKMQYLETSYAYNFVLNKIVSDKRSIADSTIQETTFKNTSGYYDARWYYLFNTPLFVDDLQLDISGSIDYYNNLSYIDDRKRTTKQFLYNQSVELKYSWSDRFESVVNVNYFKNNAKYDIPFRRTVNVANLFLGAGAKGYVTDDLSMGVEMSQRYNEGYVNNFMNVNQTVMNAFIEFTFLPNKLALLRLQGFDLFDQNKNMGIYSEYIDNNMYEARNARLGRYFMLSLNMRMQKMPKKR